MSHDERDREIGRLVREHGERRKEYLALSAKLKRIGSTFQQATSGMVNADAGSYSMNSENSLKQLEPIVGEVDIQGLISLLREHVRLTKHLISDQDTLKEYGVDK